jgi:7,8-dihydropterin-6-yl-methyl-4-(beta-D-ribofuranosyl)aminobenzene 5'-phosphate synthase
MALWIRADRGLVVVVGCCHAGLINTLRHALHLSGEPRLHAVVGGFHLGQASALRIDRTLEALRELAPDLIVPSHCTGDAAVRALMDAFAGRVVPGSAGARHVFDAARE